MQTRIEELEAELAALRVETDSPPEPPTWKKSKGDLKKERKASLLDSTVGKELVPLPSRGNRFATLIVEMHQPEVKDEELLASTSQTIEKKNE